MHGGVPSASVSEPAIATRQRKREEAYTRKRQRIEARGNPTPVTVSASTVDVDSETRVCCDDDCVRQALAAQGLRRMEDRCKADAIVALDVAKAHPLSQLVVALMGLVVATRFHPGRRLPRTSSDVQRCAEGREVPFGSRMQPRCGTQMLFTPSAGA